MKVLVVCSYNSGQIVPFVKEQVDSLIKEGIEIDYFKVKGKGAFGYLKHLPPLITAIKKGKYDLIHAHYGLSGLLANLQTLKPVVTTYHGSDVHYKLNRALSYLTSRLSHFNILTNKKQVEQLKLVKNFVVLPCGINTELFRPMNKYDCREKLGLKIDNELILFSSSFTKEVKNVQLAKKAIKKLSNVSLIELEGYSREQVALLINAVDAVLITSFFETGPLIAKEALACNIPVVSTDVGDVKELLLGLGNCYITSYDSNDVAEKIKWVLNGDKRCDGRTVIMQYDLQRVAKSIKNKYNKVIRKV